MVAATPTLTIDGYEQEIDPYSIIDGKPTDDPNLAGGSVILRGHIGSTSVTATVSAANLKQALGHALCILLDLTPRPDAVSVAVTAYVDGEEGGLHEIDRVEDASR
jgi:hypothetical protein